mmetsp:Transcript_24846/g.78269  ORF Transcript_24846/g.78269 Transcript_24846/m.78269 type:complete len:208 (+) Transcript_24846:288-911(+)
MPGVPLPGHASRLRKARAQGQLRGVPWEATARYRLHLRHHRRIQHQDLAEPQPRPAVGRCELIGDGRPARLSQQRRPGGIVLKGLVLTVEVQQCHVVAICGQRHEEPAQRRLPPQGPRQLCQRPLAAAGHVTDDGDAGERQVAAAGRVVLGALLLEDLELLRAVVAGLGGRAARGAFAGHGFGGRRPHPGGRDQPRRPGSQGRLPLA